MKKAAIPFLLSLIGVVIAAVVIWPERRYAAYVELQSEGDASTAAETASAGAKESRFFARVSVLEQKVTETSEIKQTIETLKLYQEEWKSVSMQDLVERYQKAVSATTSRGFEGQKQTLRIAFRHRDRETARKAADYIGGRYMALNITQSQADAQSTIKYWQRREAESEKEWTDRRESLARHQTADPDQRRRASLDVELAHQKYLKVISNVSAVSTKYGSVNQIGPKLGLIDSGLESLTPELPWWPALGWGAGGGFAMGLFVLCLPLLRHMTWKQATVGIVSAAACAAIAWLILHIPVAANFYQSTAVLRIVPPDATRSSFDTNDSAIRNWIGRIRGTVTSSDNLTNIVSNYSYGFRRSANGDLVSVRGETMEMLSAKLNKILEIELIERDWTVKITYQDENKFQAQKITQDFVARMMAEASRTQSESANRAKDFLEEEVELAAKKWTRTVHATGTNPNRLALDIELAKKRYIELKEKLAEATEVAGTTVNPTKASGTLSDPKPGLKVSTWQPSVFPQLEMLNPASLHEDREDLADYICWASAVAGFMVGLVVASRWQSRVRFNPGRCEVA